jgi:hypothetical protein
MDSPKDKDKEKDKDLDKDKRAREEKIPTPPNLDTEAFKNVWNEYLSYRRESRLKPLLRSSTIAKFNEMSEWGESAAISAIRQTIANSWTGIFPPKTNGFVAPAKKGKSRGQCIGEAGQRYALLENYNDWPKRADGSNQTPDEVGDADWKKQLPAL